MKVRLVAVMTGRQQIPNLIEWFRRDLLQCGVKIYTDLLLDGKTKG
jgi:hypothetical protein